MMAEYENMKRFALAGNPNSGKTTLFNALTGSTAHVGNWPGVTVDKKEGVYKKLKEPVHIIDLPGIYSLSPYTPEEVITRNYIIDEKPDVVINIVDATNLERNLYLTTQLLEIDVPVVVALNMSDVVKKNGNFIELEKLKKTLGVPVVEISALKGENLKELMEEAYNASQKKREGRTVIEDKNLLHLIGDVKIAFTAQHVASPLFHAIKLVELDEIEVKDHADLVDLVDEFKTTFKNDTFGADFEALVADSRYQYISKHYDVVIKKESPEVTNEAHLTKSDKIDKVMTHRIWALPIFVVIMFIIFHVTFSNDILFLNRIFGLEISNPTWINILTGMGYDAMLEESEGLAPILEGIPSIGVFLQSWMGWLTGSIIDLFAGFMPEGEWYTSLVCDGLLTGLDAVLSFVPQIMILFLFIAILEDSGYMARVAFILDRAFRKFGLSGKAFIPMLTGFGCSVPAIMATRTLENEREKNLTIRLMTCFSCGAKAPIWALLATIGAWVGIAGDIFVFTIYIGGIVAAIIFALFMKLFSKDQYVSPFIMELPQYHLPQARNVSAHLWEKLKHYVIKAGTIIAAATIVIWFLSNFGWGFWNGMVDIEESMLADVGRLLRYFFYPLGALEGGWTNGVDGWKYSVSVITGLIAKEDVVATMAELGLTETTIALSGAGAYSFAVYNLFTIPCFAAIGAAYGEQKGKEFWKTMAFWFFVSYLVALIVYWLGSLLSIALYAGLIVLAVIIALIIVIGIIVSKRQRKALI